MMFAKGKIPTCLLDAHTSFSFWEPVNKKNRFDAQIVTHNIIDMIQRNKTFIAANTFNTCNRHDFGTGIFMYS